MGGFEAMMFTASLYGWHNTSHEVKWCKSGTTGWADND